jgi:hypothetical protein
LHKTLCVHLLGTGEEKVGREWDSSMLSIPIAPGSFVLTVQYKYVQTVEHLPITDSC